MERPEIGVQLKLLSMGFIDDEGEKMDVIREDDHSTSSKQWAEVKVYQLRMLFDETEEEQIGQKKKDKN